jgi:hypothetical protein
MKSDENSSTSEHVKDCVSVYRLINVLYMSCIFLIVLHQVQQQMYSAWGLGGAAPPGANAAAAAYLRSTLPGAAVPAAVPKKTQKKAPKAWCGWEALGSLGKP